MRTLLRTEAFDEFYNSLDKRVAAKVDYVADIMIKSYVVSPKFVKKLENTEFYEMRISVDNEYRVILFAVGTRSFMESKIVVLLNGFVKKSTGDYSKQVRIAEKIIEKYRK